jgi:shikimate dehydrogenase
LRGADLLADAGPLDGPEARRVLSRAEVVVHCTTVGMGTSDVPFDVKHLPEGAAVLDLVYAGAHGAPPGETALLSAARARGLRTIDGLTVLVHQAIASLEVWLPRARLAGGHVAGELRSLYAELRAAALEAA